jgi:ferric-dicitrate binding protein FerR (iron transport regulator)
MQEEILKDLLDQYLTGEITEEDKKKLLILLESQDMVRQLEILMKESFDQNRFQIEESDDLRVSIQGWLSEKLAETETQRPARSFRIARWMAAASVILALCFGAYIAFYKKEKEPVVTVTPRKAKEEIKAPKEFKATITLANGKKVFLDNIQDGTLASEGEVDVVKLADGRIVYKGSSTELLYNTLNNPRGSKVISITLSDGTIVFLDAGSSIRYPVSFNGTERKVDMTGQAWFDVKHNEKKPFKVTVKNIEMIDLGTQFNVNAFDDENLVRTTLIEGSVRVVSSNQTVTIRPGEQTIVSSGSIKVAQANLQDVMAWKNGFFSFRHSTIPEMMRQLSRWYDVEVGYEGVVTGQEFTGKIDRNLSLAEVLKILEQTRVHFKMEGERKIRIMP